MERRELGEELLEVFKRLPKESFELLLRNLNIREYAKAIWGKYQEGKIEYDENFDKIFREIFEIFFRPIEILISGYRFIFGFIQPITPLELEERRDLLKAYQDFVSSYVRHFQLMFDSFMSLTLSETTKNAVDSFLLSWQNTIKRYTLSFEEWNALAESPFIIPKQGSEALFKCLEHFEEFKDEFERFKNIIEKTYRDAATNFIEYANSNEIENFNDFLNIYSNFAAKEFDKVLASKEYLETQSRMLENMMGYVSCARKRLEILLESNPLNPLATLSEVDEAYKRIQDLKRKVRELEKRIEKLEGG